MDKPDYILKVPNPMTREVNDHDYHIQETMNDTNRKPVRMILPKSENSDVNCDQLESSQQLPLKRTARKSVTPYVQQYNRAPRFYCAYCKYVSFSLVDVKKHRDEVHSAVTNCQNMNQPKGITSHPFNGSDIKREPEVTDQKHIRPTKRIKEEKVENVKSKPPRSPRRTSRVKRKFTQKRRRKQKQSPEPPSPVSIPTTPIKLEDDVLAADGYPSEGNDESTSLHKRFCPYCCESHIQINFPCVACNYNADCPQMTEKHVFQEHAENLRYVCPFCCCQLDDYSTLESHIIKKHTNTCVLSYDKLINSKEQHLAWSYALKPYSCKSTEHESCDYSSYFILEFVEHYKLSHSHKFAKEDIDVCLCAQCGYQSSITMVTYHIVTQHPFVEDCNVMENICSMSQYVRSSYKKSPNQSKAYHTWLRCCSCKTIHKDDSCMLRHIRNHHIENGVPVDSGTLIKMIWECVVEELYQRNDSYLELVKDEKLYAKPAVQLSNFMHSTWIREMVAEYRSRNSD